MSHGDGASSTYIILNSSSMSSCDDGGVCDRTATSDIEVGEGPAEDGFNSNDCSILT